MGLWAASSTLSGGKPLLLAMTITCLKTIQQYVTIFCFTKSSLLHHKLLSHYQSAGVKIFNKHREVTRHSQILISSDVFGSKT